MMKINIPLGALKRLSRHSVRVLRYQHLKRQSGVNIIIYLKTCIYESYGYKYTFAKVCKERIYQ